MSARAYAEATHPGPTLAVVGFTVAFALSAGAAGRTVLIGAAVLTGQLSIGWSNDYLDRTLDRRAGRLDKATVRGELGDRGLRTAMLAAGALCVPLSLLAGTLAGLVHLVAVGCGWSYNLGLKRTPASPLPYFVAFALVPPTFVALALPDGHWPRPALALASGLLGASAHFTNAIKDLDADALTGVRGLPQRLGARRSGLASAALLIVAAALMLRPDGGLTGPAAALAALAGLTAVGYGGLLAAGRTVRHAFTLNVLAVALLVGAVVGAGNRILR